MSASKEIHDKLIQLTWDAELLPLLEILIAMNRRIDELDLANRRTADVAGCLSDRLKAYETKD